MNERVVQSQTISAIPPRERLFGYAQSLLVGELRTLSVRRQLEDPFTRWLVALDFAEVEEILSLPHKQLNRVLSDSLWSVVWARCNTRLGNPQLGNPQLGNPRPTPLTPASGLMLSAEARDLRALLCYDQTLRVAPEFFGPHQQRSGAQWRREREDAIQEVQIKLKCGEVPCQKFATREGSLQELRFGPFLRQAIRFEFRHVLRLPLGDAQTVPLSGEDTLDPGLQPSELPSAYKRLRQQERKAAFERLLVRVRQYLVRKYTGQGQATEHQLRRLDLQLELLTVLCMPDEEVGPALRALTSPYGCSLETLQRDLNRLEAQVVELGRKFPERTLLNLSTGSLGG